MGDLATMMPPVPTPPSEDFSALYRACASDLFAYVRTLVRDDAGAEDITALAFERAYRARDRFDAARGTQRAWLFGIARNAALDELRRRGRTVELIDDVPDVTASGDPAQAAERSARRAVIVAAMARLRRADREIIALKFFAGLETDELADVLGVSTTNASTKLHRALTKLRSACDVSA